MNGQISRLVVYSGCCLFATDPHMAISIKGNVKGRPRERKK